MNKKLASDLKELGAKMEKESVTVSGTIIKIPASTSAATNYALLKDGKNQGYICGKDESFFSAKSGETYTATGKAYRVQGWKAPIIVIE